MRIPESKGITSEDGRRGTYRLTLPLLTALQNTFGKSNRDYLLTTLFQFLYLVKAKEEVYQFY